jgi:Fe(3+) dicitrate transport protein
MNKYVFIFLLLPLLAQEVSGADETLEAIEVAHESENPEDYIAAPVWEETHGTQILSGKKNTVTSLKEIPKIQTNNFRQATAKTPGLLISETPNESSAGVTSRGLGDPHESQNILLLQDGLPVASDMYGYPAAYFTPAIPMMDTMQFIRGGGGLLYGPQPAGVLNFTSNPLYHNQKLSGQAGLTYGSNNLLNTNDAIYGSKGDHSYGVEYFRRQGDGLQRQNSDFSADYLQLRDHIFKGKNKFKISFNGYNSEHGFPGGFSKTKGPNFNTYGDDQGKATVEHDRLQVSRAQLALGVESRLDESSQLHLTIWGVTYRRYSKTQANGNFGQFPTGTTNTIQDQKFYNLNGEIRYVKNWGLHTLSAGYMSYNLNSPFVQETGKAIDSNHGTVTRRLDRQTIVNSLFAENRFTFGKLLVTPGVRIENIRQTIDERKNTSTAVDRKEDVTANVPLFGLGMSYFLTDETQVYGNISEAYKPVTFAEAVPVAGGTATISEDIKPSDIITYELGYRGQHTKFNWDVSAFFIRYENKFGQVGSNFQNTGASTNKGIDLAVDYKLNKQFNIYANTEFLDAEFTRGPLKGGIPQYAPKNATRAGVIYRRDDELKAALMGTMISRHYGNDSNGRGPVSKNDYEIPSYVVFDLTSDYTFRKNWMVSGGIYNLLDKDYYSKVRAGGVYWNQKRNYYAGVTYKF